MMVRFNIQQETMGLKYIKSISEFVHEQLCRKSSPQVKQPRKVIKIYSWISMITWRFYFINHTKIHAVLTWKPRDGSCTFHLTPDPGEPKFSGCLAVVSFQLCKGGTHSISCCLSRIPSYNPNSWSPLTREMHFPSDWPAKFGNAIQGLLF